MIKMKVFAFSACPESEWFPLIWEGAQSMSSVSAKLHKNNKGTGQSAHPRSRLISAFAVLSEKSYLYIAVYINIYHPTFHDKSLAL